VSNVADDEQVEALRRWWKENGRSVIAGVVIALVGLLGWQQWQGYQRERAEAASNEYLAFLEQIRAEDAGEGAVQRGEALLEDYGSTPYGPLTAFWLAQYHVQQNQLDQAQQRLRWALENADTEALRDLARLRLGRVLLAQEQYDEALALAQEVPTDAAFAPQYAELRGDALAAQGKVNEAVSAYRAALAAQDVERQQRQLIELKLNELGGAEEPVS
jgi:predicted negative regulator of RcsB-dependent stress response